MKFLKPLLFILLAGIYFWLPWSMIRNQKQILENGVYYLFECPNQRPLYLLQDDERFAIEWDNRLPRKEEEDYAYREKVFVSLEKDNQGIAHFKQILRQKPEKGDYIATYVQNTRKKWAYVRIPAHLETYTLDKSKISLVSNNLRNAIYAGKLDSIPPVTMTMGVRILNGQVKLEKVFLNNKPAEDFLLNLEQDWQK